MKWPKKLQLTFDSNEVHFNLELIDNKYYDTVTEISFYKKDIEAFIETTPADKALYLKAIFDEEMNEIIEDKA